MNATPATAIMIKQKKIVSAFLSNDCASIENAKSLDELGLRESLIFKNLELKGVFVKCSGGKYYLDQKIWNQLRKTKLIFLAAAIVVAVTLVLLNVL